MALSLRENQFSPRSDTTYLAVAAGKEPNTIVADGVSVNVSDTLKRIEPGDERYINVPPLIAQMTNEDTQPSPALQLEEPDAVEPLKLGV